MCLHIQEIQGIGHTIAAAKTLKAATRVLAPVKQKLLLRNIVIKENPRKERKHCQKIKAAREDYRSQNQRGRSRALRTTCPSHGHIKTYNKSEDPEDHFKLFQVAAKTEHWPMPMWGHMFNSTLTRNARVWFDDLSQESIDSYDDLRKAFLENYLQQKKCIKDPVEIHNIKQRDGKSTEEFVRRYKHECRDVKGAPECMKISGFMYGITNPELIKRLHDKIPKLVDEMIRVTMAFLRGGVVASYRERKKPFLSWKQQEAEQRQNFKKGSFRNKQRTERKQYRFTLLTKTPKEILALDKGKFKPPLAMTTPDMLKVGKLSHLIKELKQSSGKDHAKAAKKGETFKKRQATTNTNEDGMEGPMIIEAEMGGHYVHHMYIDGGSSSEILYEHCFNRSRTEVKNQMIPATTPLVGFSGEIIWPRGKISLLVKIGDEEHSTSTWMNFMVELCGLLRCNLDIFAWKSADMTGVPWHVAEHRLNIYEGCLPVRQKKNGQAPERNKAICGEVKKLVEADIIKEVHYHSWLSNPVMVKTNDGSWRMCVDFKDLNKPYPKDGYPLPKIDWKVESLCGYPFKFFLDTYKGYHQIKMAEDDEEKTTFVKSQGIFCYSKMSFGLKNARATYQRLVDKAFQKQIGQNLEVYVEDLVIKSRMEKEVIKDTEETFKTLREINMKLNPKKCAFGMREGTLLGYKVDADRLRECLDKVEVVLSLPSPRRKGSTSGSRRGAHLDDSSLRIPNERNPPRGKKEGKGYTPQGRKICHDKQNTIQKSFPGPWLRSVGPLQANCVLREIHEGSCSMHSGSGFMVAKALRSGDNPFKDWCENLSIRQCFASVKHPKANGLIERANRSLGEGIKARLEERRKNCDFGRDWHANLKDYGSQYNKNNKALGINLNLVEEKREQTSIQEARSKAKMKKYYNARVQNTSFHSGDLVYRNNKRATRKTEASLDQSRRDHMKLQKHWAKEHTSLETATEIPCHEHGISATLRNVTCMKYKHLPHVRQSKREGTA
uniref:Reverse transcriptase domain-containing protein n=1 Tax=Tanacetum cinerariifolium TaxID=118510 RepID=A0A6L2LAA2_TANCI|nr:reverse transcriptase domain-containing protein [Tanacetum cinerariifolium]GEU94424.1 reverse transcriptase domain-containing protein [Tanacetum cinerariifolium]